jgi:ABC-type dipeptide/oligopeptide/nickel transport system permease subunit
VAAAPLGTDYLGRDVFSRLLHGGLSLITVTVVAVVLTYTVGIALGLTAGFLRGWVDSALMRTVDLLMAFPPLLLLLVLIVGAGSSDLTVVIGIVAVLAAPLSRLVYSATLQASATGYVEAARVRGERTRGILVREILPNIVPYILASFGAYVSGAVIFVASLSFLGVGAQPPAADWGLMITENQPVLASNPLALLAPAAMIGLITVGINLIGDAYARTAGVSEGVT